MPNPDDHRSFVAGLTREGLGRLREAQVTHQRVVRETLCAQLDAPDLKRLGEPWETAMPGAISSPTMTAVTTLPEP